MLEDKGPDPDRYGQWLLQLASESANLQAQWYL